MTTLGSQILAGLQVFTSPFNLLALAIGVLAGAGVGPLFRRIGVSGAAALVLLMPLATALDPTMGLILLGACLVTALIVTTPLDRAFGSARPTQHYGIPLLMLLAGLAIMLTSASAAALLEASAPADVLALLICGTAAAIVLAAATHPAGWTAALILTLLGLGAQTSPLAPLDTQHASPLPLLFGLLVMGPAIVALAVPQRVQPWITALGGIELVAACMPVLLLGIPVTRGISVLTLNLGESGLAFGPRLMTQRPKLVLAFLSTLVVAGAVTAISRHASTHANPRNWWSHVDADRKTRLAAAVILGLSLVALYFSSTTTDAPEANPIAMLFVATAIAAVSAWFGLELAPLVTGLVIGQLMQTPLAAMRDTAARPLEALTSGSRPLFALAVIATALALAWPLIISRFTRLPLATP